MDQLLLQGSTVSPPFYQTPRTEGSVILRSWLTTQYSSFQVGKTALLLLKLQHDFLEPGGYAELLGNDISAVQSIRPEVAKLLVSNILSVIQGCGSTLQNQAPASSGFAQV
jgi:hypothetical protein